MLGQTRPPPPPMTWNQGGAAAAEGPAEPEQEAPGLPHLPQ